MVPFCLVLVEFGHVKLRSCMVMYRAEIVKARESKEKRRRRKPCKLKSR
jgi:hypothetical protein